MRLISNEAFVDNKKLVTGRLTDDDWDKVAPGRLRPGPQQDPHRR